MEANRVGCDVTGFDINPMAYWIVRQEIEHLDLRKYREAADRLRADLEAQVGHLYRTKCLLCGRPDAPVKYFLWVKTSPCPGCGTHVRLFPGYLVAENRRHPRNVFFCPHCDHHEGDGGRFRYTRSTAGRTCQVPEIPTLCP
ncbi:MAG: hypothetical protein FJ222_11885 [Lentisphaerae bacterium]|nr:hypothetical protein [Lentisphaerota bacterium]